MSSPWRRRWCYLSGLPPSWSLFGPALLIRPPLSSSSPRSSAVAVAGNRFTGLVATVSATLWFDLFLTRPYGRLAISHRPDIETAVSLFVVGVIVTELAARNRYHYEAAAQESDYVALIYGLSELVASGAPAQKVIELPADRARRPAQPP